MRRLILCSLLLCGTALARPPYRNQAIKQLNFTGSPLESSTMSCSYCHMSDYGGAPWNPFGNALRSTLKADSKRNFSQALYTLLGNLKDSDKDGYEDALEVYAHTLPGDAKSVPNSKHDVLWAAFVKAGGTNLYAPAVRKEQLPSQALPSGANTTKP